MQVMSQQRILPEETGVIAFETLRNVCCNERQKVEDWNPETKSSRVRDKFWRNRLHEMLSSVARFARNRAGRN